MTSEPFLRVDLSAGARDFRTVALEPGLPLLDKPNANYRVLKKWLGRLIAEPAWRGNLLEFFVIDDQSRRLHEVECIPVNSGEVRRNRELATDLEDLQRRLEQCKPENQEGKLRDITLRQLRGLAAEGGVANSECHFFKYRDGAKWRLVWCWGYDRKDSEPGIPAICSNSACASLFVKRADQRGDCPVCKVVPVKKEASSSEKAEGSRSRFPWLVGTVLVLLVAGALAGYWFSKNGKKILVVTKLPAGLSVRPASWTGPVGSRIRFAVKHRSEDGAEKDVTAEVVAVAEDPKVLRIDRDNLIAGARGAGKTAVHFYWGGMNPGQATVQVEPPKNPISISIEPANPSIAVGTTTSLAVIGAVEGGQKVDLTEAVEWLPVVGANVSCFGGAVEGLAAGEAIVSVRYRATADLPYLEATAKVSVAEEEIKSLVVSADSTSVLAGRTVKLKAEVTTTSGKKYPVLGSSQLKWTVDSPKVVAADGQCLRGLQPGDSKVRATYRGLTSEFTAAVAKDTAKPMFEVKPKELRLVVGEVVPLDVLSSSSEALRIVSSAPNIVEVVDGRRVVGRGPGAATIAVEQQANRATVEVQVARAAFQSIAFIPGRLGVPVDGESSFQVVAFGSQGEKCDLAADQVVWEQLPAASYATMDVARMALRGLRSTGDTPQSIVARCGDLRASARVDVVSAPLRLEITPPGPVVLPSGQSLKFQIWANYGNGRRVELPSNRVQWKSDPASAVKGLEWDSVTAKLLAKEPKCGPLRIAAVYQGSSSNSVVCTSTDQQPVALKLTADRSMILAGESEQVRFESEGGGNNAFLPDGVTYATSDASRLAVDPLTGVCRGVAPGDVTVTASGAALKSPAEFKMSVVDPAQSKLVLRPESVRLLVGNRCLLELFLVAGAREEKISLVEGAGGVELAIDRPESILWTPPHLQAVAPAASFGISATFHGMTGRANVEVLAPTAKEAAPEIRVVPAQVSLAPEQSVSPRVEQQVPGGVESWQEVQPDLVAWKVPAAVNWTPAKNGLKPSVSLAAGTSEPVTLEAELGGKMAKLIIQAIEKPQVSDGSLSVVREPEGEQLAVGRQQRYTVTRGSADKSEPVVGIQWQAAFENDYVKWEPPLLTAKKEGGETTLTATVGEQSVKLATRTVASPEASYPATLRTDKPKAVRISSQNTVRIPVRARFGDFKVEAEYEQGAPRDVTSEAGLFAEGDDPAKARVAFEEGKIAGLLPGKVIVQAEYAGVKSTDGLSVEVVEDIDIASVELSPPTVTLRVKETADVKVTGFTGTGEKKVPVGDVTERGGVEWRSNNPDIVKVQGPSIIGIKPGKATYSVKVGSATTTGQAIVVAVDAETDAGTELAFSPKSLRMKVGETKRLGSDVTLKRKDVDLSKQLEGASASPDIVRYQREKQCLEAVSPGKVDLAFTYANHRFSLPVVVDADGQSPEAKAAGKIVVEPAAGTIAVGEMRDLHVYLVTADGKTDRSSSASLESSAKSKLGVVGTRVTGLAPGEAGVTVRLPEVKEAGNASFTIADEKLTELDVTPPELEMAIGDEQAIRVTGVSSTGRRDLGGHPDLKVTVAGENPDAVEISGVGNVRAATVGKAVIEVKWRDVVAKHVSVVVTGDPLKELRIEPPDASVNVGERVAFQIFAKRGKEEKALVADDGVELTVADTSVAESDSSLSVVGSAVGETDITARVGSQQVVARLHVTAASQADKSPQQQATALRFVPDTLTMQIGVPSTAVRLMKTYADGQESPLNELAEFDVQPPDVVEVKQSACGITFSAKKAGRTLVAARQGDLKTRQPLQIMVADAGAESVVQEARLSVSPDPLQLTVGGTGEFREVQLELQNGGTPVPVDYSIESQDKKTVSVDGKTLRGLNAGRATVIVSSTTPDKKDLKAKVSVEVASALDGDTKDLRLALSGPSRTSVGAEVQFKVVLTSDAGSKDVTHDDVGLVMDRDQLNLAEVEPGCVILAKSPGTLTVRAIHKNLVSDPLQLQIDPLSKGIERLELEIDVRPLAVGEVRNYRLWAYPVGGAPRQDLTRDVVADGSDETKPRVALQLVEPKNGGEVVLHKPPKLIAKAPGRVVITASFEKYHSEPIQLEVIQSDSSGSSIAIEPKVISVRVGERTPQIRVTARNPGEGSSRTVEAVFEIENPEILAAVPEITNQFEAKSPGKTRIKAIVGKQEAWADVSVLYQPFRDVRLQPETIARPGGRFQVVVAIEAIGDGMNLEYRIVPVGKAEGTPWKAATAEGTRHRVQMESIDLPVGPVSTEYHLMIEVRGAQQTAVERYPLDFRIKTGTLTVEQQKPSSGKSEKSENVKE